MNLSEAQVERLKYEAKSALSRYSSKAREAKLYAQMAADMLDEADKHLARAMDLAAGILPDGWADDVLDEFRSPDGELPASVAEAFEDA